MSSKLETEDFDPLVSFTYGLKSVESRRQYPRRFKVFLDSLDIKGSLTEQAREFWSVAKENPRWAEDKVMKFITIQNQRVHSGIISPSTVPNYYKATKLFCEMNEITLNWKKISKGLPRVRDAANDRAPTIQEIQKLVQYPDRRIKPLIFLMASSGIRIGAFEYLQWKHVIPMYDKNNEIVAAMVEGRSTYARWGLSAHVTAPLIEPSFFGNITLEMYNHGKFGIDITVGKDTVCQLIFYRVSSSVPSEVIDAFGRYRGQSTPEPEPYRN